MYRGIVPPLLGVTPIFAVSFWAYDLGKNLVYAATPKRETPALTTSEITAAGFFSAVPTTLIAAPVERAKVLLQVQGQGTPQGKQYSGVLDVVKGLYKEGGIRSIFRGTFATLARDGPGSAAYFAAYEVAKKSLTPKGKEPGDLDLGAIIVAGGLAGVAMWSIAIPPDVSERTPIVLKLILTLYFRSSNRDYNLHHREHILGSWTARERLWPRMDSQLYGRALVLLWLG